MDVVLPLDQMTVEEKLRVLEQVWEDLLRHGDGLPMPAWHGEVLAAREARVKAGEEGFVEWDEAIRRIREMRDTPRQDGPRCQ